MKVVKRSGKREDLDITKIRKVIGFATEGLNVDPYELEMDAHIQFRDGISTKEIQDLLIKTASEKVSPQYPDWQYVASRLLLYDLYKEVSHKRKFKIKERENDNVYNPYKAKTFLDLIKYGIEKGIYLNFLNSEIYNHYTEDEIKELGNYLKHERDLLFTYTGLKVLTDRYLTKDEDGKVLELPQEMYMLIAMTLGINEKKEKRLFYVKKFYDLISNHYISVATPILMNARKNKGQLSSCFVLTIDDNLLDIYDNVKKSALISKHAGGLGIYMGKIRSIGSPIQHYKGACSGVIPPIKVINDTMVYVNQLGVRKGSASITLDIWHPEILDFLELKTNAGDERKKAHDIHPAISIPDLFMKRLENKENWTLINPYYARKYIKEKYGIEKGLEDFYGEEFEKLYIELENNLSRKIIKVINSFELWKRLLSVIFETGEPFIFFRDTSNKLNPNKHCGIVYSSNLCMEIIQNMKSVKEYDLYLEPLFLSAYDDSYKDLEKESEREYLIVEEKVAGDVVVCNLASINLGKFDSINNMDDKLKEICRYAVRILDNTIDINYYPIPDAEITNNRYRAIGIGVNNYHYFLVKNGIKWESEEHLKFVNKLFEKIAYYVIESSMELAKERGLYPLFNGSDWDKGIFFGRSIEENNKISIENGNNFKWDELYEEIKKYGLRNGYLLALMPTGSTSLIIGSTPSIDPIFAKYYKEENMSGILPQVPPEIDKYFWHYKTAYDIEQEWIIKVASERQKWIDQSQSLNLFIKPNEIDGYKLSNLYILAWKLGLKTIYYCRSKSLTDIDECESCIT